MTGNKICMLRYLVFKTSLNLRAIINKRNAEQWPNFLMPQQNGKALSMGMILASKKTTPALLMNMEKAP